MRQDLSPQPLVDYRTGILATAADQPPLAGGQLAVEADADDASCWRNKRKWVEISLCSGVVVTGFDGKVLLHVAIAPSLSMTEGYSS